MEIETQNGTTIPLNHVTVTDFGRGLGFNIEDRTVSRRHISFNLKIDKKNVTDEEESGFRAQFEVIGKNPMWVRKIGGNGEVRVYKSGDVGEMKNGDLFCVSGEKPVWFKLRRKVIGDDEMLERLGSSSGDDDDGDVLDIDPVKEFGFLVMGNEFNAYSMQMIRDITKWNWFLEEPKKDSDDEGTSNQKRVGRKKKKKTGRVDDDDDDEWTDESEDGKQELVSQPRKVQKTNYSTRSKDQKNKSLKNLTGSKKSMKKSFTSSNQGDEDDNEDEDNTDDDTLGGFIVGDVEEEEEEKEEEDDEEEFIEDDDEELEE